MSVESALARIEKKASQRVAALALEYHGDLRETLSAPGQGRQYGKHRASAPGDPPAVQSGTLRNSIQAVQLDPLTWAVGVAGKIKHPASGEEVGKIATYLEFGSRRVAARPFVRPTLDAFKKRHKGRP
ncbi:hypothetical protein [Deinococcus phoenicis]|uniref:hypothetical protein n=1 Tax=Deinococcus phoenicis TaxID=1476583 RepID=UPI00126822FB|nr:hypothetical protein [Deinococcus phoenicis]